MGDSLFQVTGISSGIDWGSIIDKTIEAAKKPATQWQNKIDTLEVKKTLYQQLSSEFYKLRNTLTPLKLESTYLAKTAEFAVRTPAGADPASIVKATVKTDAAISSWDLDIQQIARTQRHISGRVSDPSAALNLEGKFRIMADERWTTIEIEKGDTIRTINQKLQNAKDQFGNSMPITAQLVDNRLVIDSLNGGLNNTGVKTLEPITMSDSDLMYLPRAGMNYSKDPAEQTSYPPQLLSVSSGSTTYIEGVDYTYDASKGLITWKTGAGTKRPSTGEDADILYMKDTEVTYGGTGVDSLPHMPSGAAYDPGTRVDIYKSDGKKYTQATKADVLASTAGNWDYYVDYTTEEIVWNTNPGTRASATIPGSGDKYTIRIGAQSDYATSQNKFYMEADDMTSNSILAKLGFITMDDNGDWLYPEGGYIEAQDAKLKVNGVPITRQTNTIDDIVANVTLELKGEGKLTMDITQDAQKAVDGVQAFIDQYNQVMTWINTYVNEKSDKKTTTDDEDHLSSLIQNSKGNTVFGLLHGDQLLWSIKNQMRNLMANPITTLSGTLNSKKFLHPAEALSMQGAFYINVGGMSAKINVSKTDSLEDIQKKLQQATNAVASESGALPPSPKSLGLNVTIQDGQLVISTAKTTSTSTQLSSKPLRSKTEKYDYLPVVTESASPVSGVLAVYQGNTMYEEGKDFRVTREENSSGVIQSKIVWLDGGKAPKTGEYYNVEYGYNGSAISYSFIEDSSSTPGGGYSRSLSELGLHQDSSKILLSKFGITTESTDYGKSGLLEFDSDKFFEALKEDPKAVSTVMTSFMRDIMDTYIGNLVDSTSIVVGSSVVTKGRVATQLNAIDTEIGTLNKQITKLEKSLEQKQAAMYKRYTDMEQAIQKLNAQMSSMSQYFNNASSKGS